MNNNRHVCFVNSLRELGGAELWFVDAARGLADRGFPTSIIAQPDSALAGHARERDIPVKSIPIRFDGAPWTLSKLVRYFRQTRVTALVCNMTKDLKAAGLAGLWAGVPVRLASRESDFPLKDKLYYRWYFGHVATGVLVNSEATRRTVLDSVPWLERDRVHLLYKGIDRRRFNLATDAPSARPPVVGFVGQLIARKGLPALMKAWEFLDAADWPDPPPVLRLAGEGALDREIRTWGQSLRRPECVELVGFVDDVPTFWHGCRCAVLPSLAEGFGLAAAEASACGLPVVATRASSLPELVHHEKTGLLVPPNRSEALAAALTRLLRHPGLADDFGQAGHRFVAATYDHEHTLDQLQSLVCPEDRP